jgi:eukaryotic-like serine/threonine-protein kinase
MDRLRPFLPTMLTERTNSEPNWSSLSGTVFEGGYEAGELLEADSAKARFRIRVLGDRSIDAFMDVFHASGPGAEEQLAIWQSARELAHKNLNLPLAAGRAQVDGAGLIYVVLRKPDETLSGVLRERPLTANEAGEVLLNVSGGLAHLHERGFSHGCLSPEQVFAMGDSINLSTVCIRRSGAKPSFEAARGKYRAPESATENLTPEADVWCLGATLFEVLTQKDCGTGCREQAAQLPGRFGKIVQQCLDPDPVARVKLPEVLSLYREEQKPVAPLPPQPVLAASRVQARQRSLRMMPLIYLGLALLLVLLVIWAARPKHSSAPQTPMAKSVPEAPPRPAPGSAWQTRTLPPESATARTADRPARPAVRKTPEPTRTDTAVKTGSDAVSGQVWRVVLLTYAHQEDAEKKAQSLNEKHPDLRAEVFSPKGQGGPYLVTAGGRMTREDAARLRQKVLNLGMPRDSYIQNYQQ